MVRHTDDNDKKPRPRQGAGPRKPDSEGGITGKRYSADKPGGKPGDRPDRGKPRAGGKDAKDGKGGGKTPAEPKRSERIAKAMARAGIASRREVERLIGLGKVAVNGKILSTPAVLVTRDDVITVDGKPMGAASATRVWRYHKPAGLVTSHNDPQGRPTVFDALPSGLPRVISVGRLDLATEGLLLLTNDGELSRALELPSTELVRHYRARARGRVTQAELDKLKDGCVVDGERYGPITATLDKAKDVGGDERGPANLWVSVSVAEGKNREVRKVLESVGLKVNRLIRLAYGPFQLGTLPVGSVEEVGPRVIREMLAEHIRPENLPTGNTVETPAPIPGRRTGPPIVRGKSGSAVSDPSRKPSRARAADAAVADAAERATKPPSKQPGWAKAAPKFEHKKTFKPRARPEGAEAEGERPKRVFKPRDDQFIDKPRGDVRGGGSRGPGKPAFGGKSDGPKRDFKPGGPRPSGGFGGKPAGPRSGPRPGGAGKPRGPRSGG
ncbi:MAG: pseudouridine synthase [Pseudomonadota bacterium]